ncbi:MAG: CBS domain-containing protein [Acidimicrobiales bacterium]
MRRHNISSLVVDTEPISLVTERDLVRAMADGRALSDAVSSVATRAPVWIPPTVTVAHAAAIMAHVGLRHLVVVDLAGEPAGVLSIRDALDAILRSTEPDGWLAAFPAVAGDVG